MSHLAMAEERIRSLQQALIQRDVEVQRLETELDTLRSQNEALKKELAVAEQPSLTDFAALQAELAGAKDDRDRWHKAFLDAKYPYILPTRHDLEAKNKALETECAQLREATANGSGRR